MTTTFYVVLNVPVVHAYGHELFLTPNGVVLVYDDLPTACFSTILTPFHTCMSMFFIPLLVIHFPVKFNLDSGEKMCP